MAVYSVPDSMQGPVSAMKSALRSGSKILLPTYLDIFIILLTHLTKVICWLELCSLDKHFHGRSTTLDKFSTYSWLWEVGLLQLMLKLTYILRAITSSLEQTWVVHSQKHAVSIDICDTRAQNPSLVVFGFLIQSYSTLHLLQNTFYRVKISHF